MEYDVFISCKSEDYKYAEEIYQFLVDNGFNTFLASKELRNLGDSEYRRSISAAMKSTYHMILFASNPDYIDSTWVYYEWDMFINAKLKGFKQGQIVTILKDVDVNEINMDLWKYESFTLDDYKSKLLPYMETPAYLQRKEEEEKRKSEAEKAAKREAEEKAQTARRIAKAQAVRLAEEYKKKVSEVHSIDVPKLYKALKHAEITKRICPVCGAEMDIVQTFCNECCWNMSPLDGIAELEYLVSDQHERTQKAKARFEDTSGVSKSNIVNELQCKLVRLEKEREELEHELMRSKEHEQKLLADLKRLEDRTREIEIDYAESVAILRKELEATIKTQAPQPQAPKPKQPTVAANPTRSNLLTEEQFNEILIKCACIPPYGGIFDHTKLKDVGFDHGKFKRMLSDRYGIKLGMFSSLVGTTVGDLKKQLGI
jgi:hypothetical protein